MKYYYLISLLPTLDLEDDSYSLEQLDELLDQISSNLADEDREFLNYLLHENDNQNLLYILFKEYKDFEIRTFNQPLSIPMEVLQNYRRSYASLPSYLIDYLNDFAGTFSSMSMTEMEQNLNRYFYDSLLQQNCLFLHTYYAWLFQLKQTISCSYYYIFV